MPACVHPLSRLDALRRSSLAVGGFSKRSTETAQRCIGQHGIDADLQLIFEDRCGTGPVRAGPQRDPVPGPGQDLTKSPIVTRDIDLLTSLPDVHRVAFRAAAEADSILIAQCRYRYSDR
jgi:hypothetical protein